MSGHDGRRELSKDISVRNDQWSAKDPMNETIFAHQSEKVKTDLESKSEILPH
jgi:hypothetical protein